MRLCTITMAIVLAARAFAQTNAPLDNFTLVTNLWYEGHKSNVLAIAEQRLANNSADIAGLIIKMEYNLAFTNIESFSNDIHRVLLVGAGITNTTFCTHFPKIQENLQYFLSFLEHDYRPTPESIAADKAKASFIHKRMTYEDYLKWLHDDGLF